MLKKRTSKYGVSKKEDRTYNGKVYDSNSNVNGYK